MTNHYGSTTNSREEARYKGLGLPVNKTAGKLGDIVLDILLAVLIRYQRNLPLCLGTVWSR